MLYRHAQTAFVSTEHSAQSVRGPSLRVRPLDSDAPDHLMRFVLWAVLVAKAAPPPPPDVADDKVDPDRKRDGGVVVVTAPPRTPTSRAQLLIEMSPDGETWLEHTTVDPSDQPNLVRVPQMLRYVRVRLDPNGSEARGYALVMANAPFELQGGSPNMRPNDVIVVSGKRR